MTMNKWTVALAATGLVSLASVVSAEEKSSPVLTSVAATTISGYVDTSAQWNLGSGNANVPPYRFNNSAKADGFNLDVVQLRIEKPLDESEWAAGYRVDLWAGPDANALNTQSTFSTGKGDFAIRQAYVALRMPIGNGLDWKIGVFDSIVGYESVESPNNPNYTRSYGHTIEPQTHTGVLATYRFSQMVSASAGVANTVGPAINSRAFAPVQPAGDNAYSESYKTYMGSIAVTAPDSLGFLAGSTVYGGVVNGFNNSILGTGFAAPSLNAYIGSTVATPVTGLRVGLAWDLLNVNTTPHSTFSPIVPGNKVEADVWTLAAYASYQATEKLSLHGRFEYATGDIDKLTPVGGFSLPRQDDSLYAVTATAQYDIWRNVVSRLEFRWDHIEHLNAFGGTTGGPTGDNALMIAANLVYKF